MSGVAAWGVLALFGGLWAAGRWYRPTTKDSHGSARWASNRDLERAGLRGSSGLLLGKVDGRPLRYSGPGHLLTTAPTRSGKGVSSIIPNLLHYPGSVFCIDPKGENAAITAKRRKALGQAVHVLDPWGVSGLPTARFNPLDWLDPAGLDLAEDAALLADAIVYDPPGQAGEAHWNEEAKALVSGIMLHVVTSEPSSRCHLGTVRELLTLPPDDFMALLGDMSTSGAAGGLVARAAARHIQKSDREASGVLSAAQRHTHFLDSPRMVQVLAHSDFDMSDLKQSAVSVFLALPPDRLPTYGRWLRLLVSLWLTSMARTPGQPTHRVLGLLDELAALGYLAPVETAFGLMAGYGVQLWPFLQDFAQLRKTYPKWESMLANADVLQVFGTTDQGTAELLSKMLGSQTISVQQYGKSKSAILGTTESTSETGVITGRPLLMPDEIRRMAADEQLLFLKGQPPILGRKLAYYRDAECVGLFDPNPMHVRA